MSYEEIVHTENAAASGGFIRRLDHRRPPDVSHEDHLYYLEVKLAILSISPI